MARDPGRATALAALGVEVHRGDITDRESLRAPLRGADAVYHVAAWYKVGARNADEARRINVDGTRNVLELARELGAAKCVYTSTLAVFGDTRGRMALEGERDHGPFTSVYDLTKWEAHWNVAEPLQRAGAPIVIVQPGVIYGPGDQSVLHETWVQYLTRRLPLLPQGAEYCFAHVDDVVEGHVLAMDRGRAGESYIIAGPRHSMIEAITIAERITGVPAPRFHASPALLRAMAGVMGVVGAVVPLPQSFSAEGLRAIAGATYVGDNTKAKRELGYAPRALEAGLPDALRWELEQLGVKPAF